MLARYRLYKDAIQHFQNALGTNPDSEDVKFDLADAYFRNGLYPQALEIAQQGSASGQQDDAFLSLLGDIKAHLGQTVEASEIFKNAIHRNPDNDQYYLSLTLLQLRLNDLSDAAKTLREGLARIPGSGKLLWGQGLLSVLEGQRKRASNCSRRLISCRSGQAAIPRWACSIIKPGKSTKPENYLSASKAVTPAEAWMSIASKKLWKEPLRCRLSSMNPCPCKPGSNCCNSRLRLWTELSRLRRTNFGLLAQ